MGWSTAPIDLVHELCRLLNVTSVQTFLASASPSSSTLVRPLVCAPRRGGRHGTWLRQKSHRHNLNSQSPHSQPLFRTEQRTKARIAESCSLGHSLTDFRDDVTGSTNIARTRVARSAAAGSKLGGALERHVDAALSSWAATQSQSFVVDYGINTDHDEAADSLGPVAAYS